MIASSWAAAAAVAAFPALTRAQQSGWVENQVNATMCYWEQLRASVVRDTLYLDGGNLWWIPGLADGQYGPVSSDGNPLGLVYTLNFSMPFHTTQNISALFQTLSKAPNGGAANNIAPNYYDGAMLANDHEWFLYGGLLKKTDAFSEPHDDDVTAYQADQYGTEKPGFRPGFLNDVLPEGMTRYITFGGAANAPSENKAWYFSGMRAPDGGPIYTIQAKAALNPTNVSNTLITLDMATQQQEKWSNVSLPEYISGRANPELVWVPVGEQGILVALGGVTYPDFVTIARKSSNEAASVAESPAFMSTIDIYDIANSKWYQQPTTGGPSQLTRGCAVVAAAQDGSSFNIYYYGGYDGLHPSDPFSDDVWILSLPSFMWMKIYSSQKSKHGRAGHKCVKPYPDQMFVVGGYTSLVGGAPNCVDGNIIQLFNLSSGEWMTSYDPSVWSEYSVPEMIYNMIGGSEKGGATMTTPTPTGWATPALSGVFATPYPTKKINNFYPYGSVGPGNNTRPEYTSSSSGLPGYVPILLGVICGLMLLSAIAVAIILYRRRKLLRSGGAVSDAGTEDNGNRIFSWLRAQPTSSGTKAPTVTTTTEDITAPFSPDMETGTPVPPPVVHHEMADTQVAELPDTSPRVELQDTGLTPVDIINKHSHFAPGRSGTGSQHNSSYYSSIAQTDHASTVSQSSGSRRGLNPPPAPHQQHPGSSAVRPDSPPLGTTAPVYAGDGGAAAVGVVGTGGGPRGESGVSGLSERDRAHLRQISDGTVSSIGTARGGDKPLPVPHHEEEQRQQQQLEQQVSPVVAGPSGGSSTTPISPPSPGFSPGEGDYMSAQRMPGMSPGSMSPGAISTGSPLRRSVFYENPEDMDGRPS